VLSSQTGVVNCRKIIVKRRGSKVNNKNHSFFKKSLIIKVL
jgi:hypothetical protein